MKQFHSLLNKFSNVWAYWNHLHSTCVIYFIWSRISCVLLITRMHLPISINSTKIILSGRLRAHITDHLRCCQIDISNHNTTHCQPDIQTHIAFNYNKHPLYTYVRDHQIRFFLKRAFISILQFPIVTSGFNILKVQSLGTISFYQLKNNSFASNITTTSSSTSRT